MRHAAAHDPGRPSVGAAPRCPRGFAQAGRQQPGLLGVGRVCAAAARGLPALGCCGVAVRRLQRPRRRSAAGSAASGIGCPPCGGAATPRSSPSGLGRRRRERQPALRSAAGRRFACACAVPKPPARAGAMPGAGGHQRALHRGGAPVLRHHRALPARLPSSAARDRRPQRRRGGGASPRQPCPGRGGRVLPESLQRGLAVLGTPGDGRGVAAGGPRSGSVADLPHDGQPGRLQHQAPHLLAARHAQARPFRPTGGGVSQLARREPEHPEDAHAEAELQLGAGEAQVLEGSPELQRADQALGRALGARADAGVEVSPVTLAAGARGRPAPSRGLPKLVGLRICQRPRACGPAWHLPVATLAPLRGRRQDEARGGLVSAQGALAGIACVWTRGAAVGALGILPAKPSPGS
mmetsp:Transcript_47842/g.152618  ORF Transcript_47842/g.152618 Transcript_47842/m.152618 type:complete len:409 (+) Transcript_47842:2998-4224(+)